MVRRTIIFIQSNKIVNWHGQTKYTRLKRLIDIRSKSDMARYNYYEKDTGIYSTLK